MYARIMPFWVDGRLHDAVRLFGSLKTEWILKSVTFDGTVKFNFIKIVMDKAEKGDQH